MIGTERLLLRPWNGGDLEPFAAMCADAAVMAHLNGPIDRDGAAATIARARSSAERDGLFLGNRTARRPRVPGLCGLRRGGHPGTPVSDELEIGWRLARHAWGQGYAREAAVASLEHGWKRTDAPRIAAWTVAANAPSWGLMERLGMERRSDLDFSHPGFGSDDLLYRHIVYTIDRPTSD